MKISIDDQELFMLSETQKNVIKNDIHEDEFEDDMKRRVKYILMHKYEQCLERLKKEWMQKFKDSGVSSIPLDDDKFAELVFAQHDYESKKMRTK